MTQLALDEADRARRRRLRYIDDRLVVHARHLHLHRTSRCPDNCDLLLLLDRIDMWLERRLKEM